MTLDEYADLLPDDGEGTTEYSTKDYVITHAIEEGKTVYQLVNREYQVVEYIDHLLPRTINTMLEIQKELESSRRIYNNPKLKVVEKDDDEGEHGLH